jgi:hypothetical protein
MSDHIKNYYFSHQTFVITSSTADFYDGRFCIASKYRVFRRISNHGLQTGIAIELWLFSFIIIVLQVISAHGSGKPTCI